MLRRSPIRPPARAAMLAALLAASLSAPVALADPPVPPAVAAPTPLGNPAAAAARDAAAAPLSPALSSPEPFTVDLGLVLGPSVRMGDAPSFQIADRAGLALGVGAAITPTRRFSVGLSYEHVGLGREVAGGGNPDFVDVSRSLDSLWADLGLHVFESPRVRLSVLLGVALNWQHANASAALSQDVGMPLLTIQCSASDSANFSFRAGLGGEFVVGNGVSLLAHAVVDEVRLSSGPLDECVTGAGTMTLLSARVGAAYHFDVTRLVR